jgi:hypothetical protein
MKGWKRKYYLKYFKITSPSNEFFLGAFYNNTLSNHFEILKNKYLDWVVNDTSYIGTENKKIKKFKKNYYMPIFGFFQEFGMDCKIKIIYETKGSIKSIKSTIDYLVDGLKDFKNCYNLKI